MGAAIGFMLILLVMGVFLPDILNALSELALIIIEKAIVYVNML